MGRHSINKAKFSESIQAKARFKGSDHSEIITPDGVVHRPWGTYVSVCVGESYQVKRITVNPGEKLSLQFHNYRSEHWTIVSGRAHIVLGKIETVMAPDESIYIPLGTVHRIENRGKETVELIEVQYGGYLGEDDIVRLEDVYNRK